MLVADKISLHFGTRAVFDEVSFNINSDQRIGLVGRNGSGKTTLLKVIAGKQGTDEGFLNIQKGAKVAYLPQEVVLLSDKTIFQEALSVFAGLDKYLQELSELEQDLSDPKKIERYSLLQQKLIELGCDDAKVQAERILLGLGFKLIDLNNSVQTLSVGWKMRLVLAKLLLQKADFYLFDEPTNHLDLVAKDWFLDFLKNSKFGFVLVCHDRYFLDHLCEQIYEVDRGKLNVYRGNYSKYVQQKEKDVELLEKKYEEQQKYIKKQMATIERFRASATKSKMAQSMLKSLEKMERVETEHKQKDVRLNFGEVKRSGKIVLTVKNLSKHFGDKKIFERVCFEIERSQKVAIVAPNGVGKTTLLNVITGKYDIENGSIEFGHNVEPVIFEQDQNKSLNLENTILDETLEACKTSGQRQRVRSLLGAFLFPGDDVDKKIRVLSGGEKNRVAMVKVLLQNANFLLLDEPTNHLDIQSKDILLRSLKEFDGTILFVSHDRDFLNKLATHIIDLTPQGAHLYAGNYDSFLYQKNEQIKAKEEKASKIEKNTETKTSKKYDYKQQKKIKNLESKIDRLEKDKKRLYEKLAVLEYGSDEYHNIYKKIQDTERKLKESFELWEDLH